MQEGQNDNDNWMCRFYRNPCFWELLYHFAWGCKTWLGSKERNTNKKIVPGKDNNYNIKKNNNDNNKMFLRFTVYQNALKKNFEFYFWMKETFNITFLFNGLLEFYRYTVFVL